MKLVLYSYDDAFMNKVINNPEINYDEHMVDNSIAKSRYAQAFTKYCQENEILPKNITMNTLRNFVEEKYNGYVEQKTVVSPGELFNSIKMIIASKHPEQLESETTKDYDKALGELKDLPNTDASLSIPFIEEILDSDNSDINEMAENVEENMESAEFLSSEIDREIGTENMNPEPEKAEDLSETEEDEMELTL